MKVSTKHFERAVIKFELQMEKTEKRIAAFLDEMQDSADVMNTCVNDVDEYLKERGR
jgi:hypothetical protein